MSADDSSGQDELLNEFLEESCDIIQAVNEALDGLFDKENKKDSLDEIFRGIHTIKGGASMFQYENTKLLAHSLESHLDKLRKTPDTLTQEDVVYIQLQVDQIEKTLKSGDVNDLELAQKVETTVPGPIVGKFNSKYFPEFESNFPEIVEQLINERMSIFEILVPQDKAEKFILKLSELGIEKLQEDLRSPFMALMFSMPCDLEGSDHSIIEKLSSNKGLNWILKSPPKTKHSAESPIISEVNNSPSSSNKTVKEKERPDVLRIPLEKINAVLENIWEIFLIRNQMAFLFERNRAWLKNNITFLQAFEGLDFALQRNIHEVESKAMGMRLSTVSSIFVRMEKTVKSYCESSKKKIQFLTEGENTELDKKVIDMLGEPLIHLVRNAMDHGIEETQERIKLGKSPEGKLQLKAKIEGNKAIIEVSDDGKGIDPQKVLESAKRKNLDVSHVKNQEDAIRLIFAPGFSTAEKVSEISGRGIGMDAVKTSIEKLGGQVDIHTQLGKGSTFRIELPLSMSVISALLVKINGHTYAINSQFILETKKISQFDLKENGDQYFYKFGSDYINCIDLREHFIVSHELVFDGIDTNAAILVIKANQKVVAVRVDEIIRPVGLVVKPCPTYSLLHSYLGGVSILQSGGPVFILAMDSVVSDIEGKFKQIEDREVKRKEDYERSA